MRAPMASAATSHRQSMSLTVAARGVHYFKVEDYTFAKKIMASASRGRHFQSDAFRVGGYDWAVRFDISYPVVSIYLVLLSKTVSGVGASFACAPLHRNGKASASAERRVCCVFSYSGQREGFSSFLVQKDLVKNYLKGD